MGLGKVLDDLLHLKPKDEHDPGRPFTPPPPEASDDEDEGDGPRYPMDPALA